MIQPSIEEKYGYDIYKVKKEDLSEEEIEKLKQFGWDGQSEYSYYFREGLSMIALEKQYLTINEGIDTKSYEKYRLLLKPILNNKCYPYTISYKKKIKKGSIEYEDPIEKRMQVDDGNKIETTKIYGSIYNDNNEGLGKVFHETNGSGNYSVNSFLFPEHIYEYKFLIETVKKYNLSDFQRFVLSINYDLLNTIYIENKLKEIYGDNETIIQDGTTKLINNLKLLIYDDMEEDVTINGLTNLKDPFIFYTDISKILEKFNNISPKDIIHLVIGKSINNYDSLINYLSIMNDMEEEDKNNLIEFMSNIFTTTLFFPNMLKENADEISTNIVNQNPVFFNEYKNFFENSLDYEYLLSIKNSKNINEILKIFMVYKQSLKESVPVYNNTLENLDKSFEIPVTSIMNGLSGEVVSGPTKRVYTHKVVGDFICGKEEINAQIDLFNFIKKESLKSNFSFNKIITEYMSNEDSNSAANSILFTMIKGYNKLTSKEKSKVLVKN